MKMRKRKKETTCRQEDQTVIRFHEGNDLLPCLALLWIKKIIYLVALESSGSVFFVSAKQKVVGNGFLDAALCWIDESAEGVGPVDACPAAAHPSSCYLGSKLITLELSQPTVIRLCALMARTCVSTCTNYPLGQIIYEMR